jgi:NADP-dependent 3-hydroxy acid dehydrogenase YdfG
MAAVAIVGAGPGIGAAIARRFAREQLAVGLISRSQSTLDGVLATLPSSASAAAFTADVTDEVALREALDRVRRDLGPISVLVYNAGLIRHDRPGELSTGEHEQAWAVNVVGAITAAAHVGAQMVEVGSGTIIFTGGMPDPMPDLVSLSLGKAGIRALADLLDKAYGPAGVHVATVTIAGAITPGTVLDPDEIADHYWRLHAQPRHGWQREVLLTDDTATAAPGVDET